MLRPATRFMFPALVLLPLTAAAEPIELKLSFFTSDRSLIHQNLIKPFVDAVNTDARDLVRIKVYFSGAISRVQSEQPQLVAGGGADLAVIVPGRTPDRFLDNTVMELPGLFRNSAEASRVFTRLIAADALKGYDDFLVVAAFVAEAESIHSRKPIASIENLKGLTIRTNNQTEAAVLERLGAIPVLLAINQTTEAVSRGIIDGATFPPSMLFEFGIGRVTSHHFMIRLGGVPAALVMNRRKFESLPAQAQAVILRYSGDRPIERAVAAFDKIDAKVLDELKADPRRTVVFPSAADLRAVRAAGDSVTGEWAASSPRNRELLARTRAAIGKLRGGD